MVLTHLESVHMDTNYWENPEEFLPDSFLEDGKPISREAYYPFSLGKRITLCSLAFATMHGQPKENHAEYVTGVIDKHVAKVEIYILRPISLTAMPSKTQALAVAMFSFAKYCPIFKLHYDNSFKTDTEMHVVKDHTCMSRNF